MSDKTTIPVRFTPGDGRLTATTGERGVARNKRAAGPFIIGPYIDLSVGDYCVDFIGEIHDFGERGIEFDAVHRNPRIENAHMDLARYVGGPLVNGTIASLAFTVREKAADVEFRALPSAGADITISEVRLYRTHREHKTADFPVWVLITGAIRDPETVKSRFRFLGEMKRRGVIQQVVFSTWQGESVRDADITGLIQEYGFQVVESDPPELVCLGHFIHQIVALDNGLQVCPDNSFVLKSRTDKSGPKEGFHEAEIEEFLAERTFAHACSSKVSPQFYKIGIFGPSAYHSALGPSLCMWHDQTYFGFKRDLQRLINYNVYAFDVHHMAPEQALFGYPLISRYSAIDRIFRAADNYEILLQITWNLSRSSAEKLNAFARQAIENKLFRHALVLERLYLSECYFNLNTNQEFPLDLSYRGIDMRSFTDVFECVESFRDGRDVLALYADDEKAFREIVRDSFEIPYRHQPSTIDGVSFPLTVVPATKYATRVAGAH